MGPRFSSLMISSMVLVAASCGSATASDDELAAPPETIDSAPADDGTDGDGDAPTAADGEETTTTEAPTTTTIPADETDSTDTADDTDAGGNEDPEDTAGDTADATAEDPADRADDTAEEPDGEEDGDGDAGGEEPVELTPVWPGDSGEAVVALQERLDELGFAPGSPDGSYGGRTIRSIKAFQGLVGLSQTGWADSPTIAQLDTYRYDGLVLRSGDEGDEVEALQKRLQTGPLDPGPADGEYGGRTIQAVWALEKLAGIPVDGDWGPLDEKAWDDLQAGEIGGPEKDHDQRWVEVDLSQQLMKVYDPGNDVPTLVSHASSGSGIPWSNEDHSGSSVTPLGDFHINRRINGWRESSLDIGRLYNPLYFNGGIALHGASSVPLYPASHGCIRLPMHIADYLPGELPDGTPVHVLA